MRYRFLRHRVPCRPLRRTRPLRPPPPPLHFPGALAALASGLAYRTGAVLPAGSKVGVGSSGLRVEGGQLAPGIVPGPGIAPGVVTGIVSVWYPVCSRACNWVGAQNRVGGGTDPSTPHVVGTGERARGRAWDRFAAWHQIWGRAWDRVGARKRVGGSNRSTERHTRLAPSVCGRRADGGHVGARVGISLQCGAPVWKFWAAVKLC